MRAPVDKVQQKTEHGMWVLRDRIHHIVTVGERVISFRGEHAIVKGGVPPRHAGSTGHVIVEGGTMGLSYYPSVYKLKWTFIEDTRVPLTEVGGKL
jgi:hypothetical protein